MKTKYFALAMMGVMMSTVAQESQIHKEEKEPPKEPKKTRKNKCQQK